MEPDERRTAGYPPGNDNGFEAMHDDVTTFSEVPDLFVLQERVDAGLVLDRAGQPLETPDDKTHLYVVGDCGKIYIALEHTKERVRGAVKHNTLLKGARAFGAGEIRFSAGHISGLNADSGTYRPPFETEDFVKELIRRAGVTWTEREEEG